LERLANSQQWALPVRFDKLVAHVEVYVETLLVITALRLCNRYRKGTACYIDKLPTELIDRIEQFAVEPEREKRLATWSTKLKCYSRECSFGDDHLSPLEKGVFYAQRGGGNGYAGWDECAGRLIGKTYEENRKSIFDKSSDWKNGALCSRNRGDIKSMTFTFPDGIHYPPLEALGIETWVTPACIDFYTDKWTALAYLVLPSNTWKHEEWQELDPDLSSMTNENGYGVPVHIGPPPSPASLKRFPYALKKLGLEVFVHQSQKHATPLSATGREKEKLKAAEETTDKQGRATEKPEAWPQLTLLGSATPDASEY